MSRITLSLSHFKFSKNHEVSQLTPILLIQRIWITECPPNSFSQRGKHGQQPKISQKMKATLYCWKSCIIGIVCLIISVMEIQVFVFKTSSFILSFYLVFTLSVFFLYSTTAECSCSLIIFQLFKSNFIACAK